jgi:hypothetical protein
MRDIAASMGERIPSAINLRSELQGLWQKFKGQSRSSRTLRDIAASMGEQIPSAINLRSE